MKDMKKGGSAKGKCACGRKTKAECAKSCPMKRK